MQNITKKLYMHTSKILRLFAVQYLLMTFLCAPVLALELDTSIDDEIRRNYNPNKIEEDLVLPNLPKVLNEVQSKPTIQNKNAVTKINTQQAVKTKNITNNSAKQQQAKLNKLSVRENLTTIKKGTKIKAKSMATISDRTKRGTKVSFISKYPVTTTYYTIPAGAILYGEVTDSHKPQFTGNGGLIVVRISSISIKDDLIPISAKVTKANDKMIFLNNIKGKRKYLSSTFNAMKPGGRFLEKMTRVSLNLARDGASILVSPFSFAIGVIGAGANVIAAPAVALCSKGNSISIAPNTDYELKLTEDVFIYK